MPAFINGKIFIDSKIYKWYKNGKLHREGDMPAFINGKIHKWYKNGNLHREGDMPVVLVVKRNGGRIVNFTEGDSHI